MVAANPTKTTAAKAAAGMCLSEAPAEVVLRGDGLELESEAVEGLELAPESELEPEPEPELELELESEPELEVEVDSAVLLDFEPVAVAVVLLEPEVVEEVSTLCPLDSQVSRKCFRASFLSSSSHLSEIVSWILSPFLMQMVFRSAGLGWVPTIERRQAGGCAAIATLHSARAEKRTVDLVKNMVLVSFEYGFGSRAYWAFRGRMKRESQSAGKQIGDR